MTCQVMLLFLNGKKIARRLIKVNFVPQKVNSSTRGKDRKGKSFQRDCTRGRGLYEIHHEINTKLRHKRFTEKLQDYPSAIFKIVQSHHARQQWSNRDCCFLKTFAPTIHRMKRRSIVWTRRGYH